MKLSKQLIFLFLLYVVHFTHAQTLKQFTFQGKLSDINENFTGTKSIEFTIYDLNDILWRETHQDVAVKNGNYELKLGSITPFPTTLFKTDVIERTVIIRVNGITQGFFRLPDYTPNNSVFNGKTLTVDFGKYGKEIDFDKIKVEEDSRKYAALCVTCENKSTLDDNDSSGLYYKYEKELGNLSYADLNKDDDELFICKIATFINKSSTNILCDPSISNKKQISILKLAVATIDWEFLNKAILIYNYPLNIIETKDSMTILDFIYEDFLYYQKYNPSSTTNIELKKYYNLYKSKGARHHKYPVTTSID
jgi:hypothetical protein